MTDLDLQYSSTVQDKIVLCQQLPVLLLFDFLLQVYLSFCQDSISKTQVLGKKIGAPVPNKAQRAKIQRIEIPVMRIGDQLMRHIFRWRSRSNQIASSVKGLSMGTLTDCGYPRGSWAAVRLNPRRESPSGWGPFVETWIHKNADFDFDLLRSAGRAGVG